MANKRKVILITDGDEIAKNAIEVVARNIGGRCISLSAGNPTLLCGRQIINLIKNTAYDPVLVMFDDKGNCHQGAGEIAMEYIIKSDEVEVLGVLAVASNTQKIKGIKPDYSITKNGDFIKEAVDKCGYKKFINSDILEGDTVDILNELSVTNIIGIGDIGKMDGADSILIGCPITTKAVLKIIELYSKME